MLPNDERVIAHLSNEFKILYVILFRLEYLKYHALALNFVFAKRVPCPRRNKLVPFFFNWLEQILLESTKPLIRL
jgi:hypothetical protein